MNFDLGEFFDYATILEIEPLGSAGGFSGARFWRVKTAEETFCLRRWPQEHPSRQHLTFIHQVLSHAKQSGLEVIPVPLFNRGGQSWSESGGYRWEATTWLPGIADFWANPSRSRLAGAMRILARFHLAAGEIVQFTRYGEPPAIRQRIGILRNFQLADAVRIDNALNMNEQSPELSSRARRVLDHFWRLCEHVHSVLIAVADVAVTLQPCIRDVWHDHVLFQGEKVSGIVDFGAMRVESVAGDISRLLGSLLQDHDEDWRALALSNYQAVRPMTADEQRLLRAFDASTPILSGMNWLRWIYLDQRQFADFDRVLGRLDQILHALHGQSGTDYSVL